MCYDTLEWLMQKVGDILSTCNVPATNFQDALTKVERAGLLLNSNDKLLLPGSTKHKVTCLTRYSVASKCLSHRVICHW